jgi:CMP-N-acetylneuraminic acid synthetase
MDQMDSIDIDTQEDFLIAEALMGHSQNSKPEPS